MDNYPCQVMTRNIWVNRDSKVDYDNHWPRKSQLLEDLSPFVTVPFKSINLPYLQRTIHCSLQCSLFIQSTGAQAHGLRQAERSRQLALGQTSCMVTEGCGMKSHREWHQESILQPLTE